MMGRLETDQGQFFHSDRLGELAPADHPARELDAVLDLSWLRAELAPYYSHNRANRIDENRACVAMVERVARRFALKPRRLAAGAAYGNARTLKSLAAHGIEPHIPVIDKSARPDRLFSRADFKYEQERDPYICPGGKGLRTSGTAHEGTTYKDMAKRSECGTCPLKPECTKGRERRLGRDIDEPIRDQVRALAKTSAFKRSLECPPRQDRQTPPVH